MWFLFACTSPPSPNPVPESSPVPVVEPVPGPMQGVLDAVKALPKPKDPRYAASHILLAYSGAVDTDQRRSETHAFELAERLLADDSDFAALARKHSDGPSGPRGGQLGSYRVGTMVPDFEKVVASLEVGERGLVHTPFGWHVVHRDALEVVHLRHIQISWAGCPGSTQTRSKEAARALAEDLATRITAKNFRAEAEQHSEDSVAARGGDLGLVSRGQMVPDFEDAAFALKAGAISGVVETVYGFHIIHHIK